MTCESVEASLEPAPRDVTCVAASGPEPGGGEPSLISVCTLRRGFRFTPNLRVGVLHRGRELALPDSSWLDAEESARVQRDPDSYQRDPEAGPA